MPPPRDGPMPDVMQTETQRLYRCVQLRACAAVGNTTQAVRNAAAMAADVLMAMFPASGGTITMIGARPPEASRDADQRLRLRRVTARRVLRLARRARSSRCSRRFLARRLRQGAHRQPSRSKNISM